MTETARYGILAFALATIVASFAIGFWAKRKVTSTQAFFGATALFGPVVVSLSTMAAVASAFALVGVPGLIYTTGNTMTFWMLGSASMGLAYIILGKKVRAMAELGEVSSLGDISDLRFGRSRAIKLLMSVILFLGCLAYLASQIKAGSELFGHLLGLSPVVAAVVIFGILTVYTAISGEVGGLLTQAFQGLIMVVAGIVMIVGFFVVTGGFGPVLEAVATAGTIGTGEAARSVDAGFLDAWGTLPPSVAMAWMFVPIVGVMGQPQVLTRMYALKDPRDMPRAALYGAVGHMVVGLMAVVMGYGALHLVATGQVPALARGDLAVFVFADRVGLVGQLFLYAAVLAAAMSSASLFLSLCAGILARDIPSAIGWNTPPKRQVRNSRIAIGVLGGASILFAMTGSEAVAILGTFGWGTLMSATFPVFVLGLLWPGATSRGVIAGLSVALVLNVLALVLSRTGFEWPGGLPWYFTVVAASVAVTVAGSLLLGERAGAEPDRRVRAVFDL